MISQEQLDRIEQKLDELLRALGCHPGRKQASEIRREAQATVLKFRARRTKKRGDERENKNRK